MNLQGRPNEKVDYIVFIVDEIGILEMLSSNWKRNIYRLKSFNYVHFMPD